MNHSLLRGRVALVVAGLALLLPGTALAQQDADGFRPFVEQPGVLEFRGVLVARPLQLATARERGLTEGQAIGLRAEAEALLLGLGVQRHFAATDEFLVPVPRGSHENALARDLMASGLFEYVEPDWLCFPVDCPNDPQFGSQWHHQANRMDSCAAWDLETGDPNVVVAICDTGVLTTHQDLQLHRYEGFNATTGLWESQGGDISPVHPHGTNCTGSAAANGDNGLGVSGVGRDLGHRMMRVSEVPDGSASQSAILLGARTAIESGDKVASCSYSGGTGSSVGTTGTYIRGLGGMLVYAAGNASSVLSGNRDDDVLLIGATDSTDGRSSFSNYGSQVDFMAPGSAILTTNTGGNASYAAVSGTSFSCPIVAGACGLIWSANPTLTPQEVEDILRQSCTDLGAPGVDDEFGYGRLDLADALLLATLPLNVSLIGEAPSLLDPMGGDTVQLVVSAGAQNPLPGSGSFWLDSGAGYVEVPMLETLPNQYTATFPAIPCGSTVSYFFTFEDTVGGTQALPATAPTDVFEAVATVLANVASDAFEANSGWTVGAPGDNATTGIWTRVAPIGTAAQPGSDHSPSGTQCWVTGQGSAGGAVGENDVDGGTTTLVSPVYDLSGTNDAVISYWRWYSNSAGAAPNADTFVIDVSDDGGATWTNVEVVGPTGAATGGGWIQHSFHVEDLVDATASVRLRFVASDLGSGSIVEAAVDDLTIDDVACSPCGASSYCVSSFNSVSQMAQMGWSGSLSVANNDLVLQTTGLPPNEFAIYIYSPDQAAILLGDGVLCVGNTTLGFFLRLPIVTTTASGTASLAFDNQNPPNPSGLVAPGQTWNFQLWYRDTGSTSSTFNLSDGLSVTFCP